MAVYKTQTFEVNCAKDCKDLEDSVNAEQNSGDLVGTILNYITMIGGFHPVGGPAMSVVNISLGMSSSSQASFLEKCEDFYDDLEDEFVYNGAEKAEIAQKYIRTYHGKNKGYTWHPYGVPKRKSVTY